VRLCNKCDSGFEDPFNGSNEPIALAHRGFHKARLLGVIVQCRTDFANGIINAVFGIEEEVLAPEFLDDLFPLDQLTLLFGQ